MVFRLKLVLPVLALLGLSVGAQGPGAPAPDAASKLTTVLAELSHGVPQEARAALARAGRAAALDLDAQPRSVRDAVATHRLRISDRNEVQVYMLLTEVTDETIGALEAAGVTIEIKDPAGRRVQARVPVSRLQMVAGLASVEAIRLPSYARHRTGAAGSEGDAILHADAVRQQFGLDGTGVRVGVISDGLKGVFATGCTTCGGVAGGPIATNDLPPSAGTRDSKGVLTSSTGGIVGRSFQANGDLEGLPPANPPCSFAGAGAEGTALLEIVYDLAPSAKLAFANADTDMAFAQAVNFLAASNDVVLDDISFFGEPYDGTSAVSRNTAAALNNAAYPIRAYFTSVGNEADEHSYGTYVDSGIDGTTIPGISTPGHLHLFQRSADTTDVLGLGAQPYNVISLPQNGEVSIFLTWDDPFGGSANDYDLYLVQQSTGRVVAKSTDVQNGRQDPVESIDFVNPGGQDFFRIVVQNVRNAAQPKALNLFSFEPECARAGPATLAPPRHERHNYNTASRSVSAQSDAGGSPAGVIAVGAICSASAAAAGRFSSGAPDESCLDTSNSTPEFFSSRGPTLDGRVKPDIMAIDGVAITGAGKFNNPFFGTSAASPHMGGIAALLLQSAPCLLNRSTSTIDPSAARGTLRSLILGHAVPLSSPAPDNTFGAGRADALAAVQATLPTRKGSSTLTFDGNTPFGASLTPGQLGFSDPNSCSLTRLKWTGGCGTSPGPTMTCPFGSSAVNVSASNNGAGFSTGVDLQIVVTDFSLDVSPGSAAVTAGQSSTYAITIAPQGGPFGSAITLGCSNLPPQAACAFSQPTLTPGASQARAMLTISTAGASAAIGPTGARRGREASTAAVVTLLCLSGWAISRRSTVQRARGVPWLHMPATGAAAIGLAPLAVVIVLGGLVSAASGIAIFPASLEFGTQTVGTAAPPRLVSITNIGSDALTMGGISTGGDYSQTSSCGASVAAGASCQVAVTFAPTAAGARTGTLTILDNAAGSPHIVRLNGTGQAAPSGGGSTPAGSYVVTISGVAGTLTHAATVTLTVQ